MMWGEQPPYKESVKIVDGNKLWFSFGPSSFFLSMFKKTEPKGKASAICDENQSSKVDPKGITNVVVDENQTLKVKSKFEMDLDKFFIPKNKFHESESSSKSKSEHDQRQSNSVSVSL
ncbi:hypothetical protein HanXRQr2_Chr06g0249991 [Helianthus annuus]|uniref:Uncharacterized protein n=1 Tax=Helianthus annuus TaxID=4232 RepID=A0A251UI28_HELAN|nr:hypothetical protein HanXRQr2_Chr06g0249991 [Helianthus annuus]